jgi:hypothetical protein
MYLSIDPRDRDVFNDSKYYSKWASQKRPESCLGKVL